MAIRSMTGFGLAEANGERGTFHVEVRGVNNRFLDVQCRLPRSMASLEQKVKQLVSSTLSRGYITVGVTHSGAASETKLSWDREAVDGYMRIFREVIATCGLDGGVTLSDLMRFSDVIKAETATMTEDEVWAEFEPVVKQALEVFQQSRAVEGAHTEGDLRESLAQIEADLVKIEQRAPTRLSAYQHQLRQRIEQLLGGMDGVDQGRLAMEVALMADKLDISEECCRMRGHLKAFDAALSSTEAAGKQLGFLLQEMNREANTICSKANDTQIAHWGVSLKEQAERIREQLQNVE
jgi:uncharacterized protein (TIGR00255 family)